MKREILLVAVLASMSAPAAAREDDLTISSHVAPVFRGGDLEGCTAVFDAVHNDFEYQQGAMVLLSGSINYYVFPDRVPAVSFKLGLRPLETPDAPFVAPAEVYLVEGTDTNKAEKLATVPAEASGFRLYGFNVGDATLNSLMAVGDTGRLTFGYSMKPGGMLSLVQVDFRFKRLDLNDPKKSDVDEAAPGAWLDCVIKASEAGMKRLEAK